MSKHNTRYENANDEESEDEFAIEENEAEEDVSPWQNGNESESESPKAKKQNGVDRESKPSPVSYKVENGVSPKNKDSPMEPLFSSGAKKQALKFHTILAAYKAPEPIKRRSSTGGLLDSEDMMEELKKMRKANVEVSNERTQLKTKILRMESEMQKKDKHIEDILGAKSSVGNGAYGKLLTETNLIANLKRQVKSLERDVGKRDEEILKMRNKIKESKYSQLEQQLAEVHSQKMQLEEILGNNRKDVESEYSDTVRTLEEVNDKMKNKLQKYRVVNKKRTTLVQQLQQSNQTLEERKSELMEENITLHTKIQEIQFQSNVKITELSERNNFLTEDNKRKGENDTKEVKALNEAIEKLRVDHKDQIDKIHLEHTEQITKLNEGHSAELKEIVASRLKEIEEQEKAATKIQANYKGYKTRKEAPQVVKNQEPEVVQQPMIQITPDESSLKASRVEPKKPADPKEEQEAAIAIQKIYKGQKTRKELRGKAIAKQTEEAKIRAVIKIQKIFRGFKTRKELKKQAVLKKAAIPKKVQLAALPKSPSTDIRKLILGEVSPRSRFGMDGFLGRPNYSKMVVVSEPKFMMA